MSTSLLTIRKQLVLNFVHKYLRERVQGLREWHSLAYLSASVPKLGAGMCIALLADALSEHKDLAVPEQRSGSSANIWFAEGSTSKEPDELVFVAASITTQVAEIYRPDESGKDGYPSWQYRGGKYVGYTGKLTDAIASRALLAAREQNVLAILVGDVLDFVEKNQTRALAT